MSLADGSSELMFLNALPRPAAKALGCSPEKSILIFDRKLLRVSPEFRSWMRQFPIRYGVSSGESLKDLAAFSRHADRLTKLAGPIAPREMTVVAVGGGSIGDFAGFFASVFKRGVRLVHVPSTWLAALDSSHGGKTALNIHGTKNQFGTFYPAARVLLVRSLLARQPEARIRDAMGELGKIALVDGGAWTRVLGRSRLRGERLIWEFLRPAILSKMRVVRSDPRETKGHRQILNLGHTAGHVFEAEFGWSHGESVAQGVFFALEFARSKGLLSASELARAESLLTKVLQLRRRVSKMKRARFVALLSQDKKRLGAAVVFIFPRGFGRVLRVPLKLEELAREARRQGWLK